MMHIHGTYRRWFATCGLLLLLSMAAAAVPVMGGGPDPGDTVDAWYEVRKWVDELRIPDEADERGTVRIGESSGCCIILRSQGRTVGIGTAREGASMVRDAARQAISNALGDHAIAALPDAMRVDAGRQLTVELEVAGPLQPLIGDSFRDFDGDIHPLHHGIALRWRDEWSMQYPSRLRLINHRAEAGRFDGMAIGLGRSPAAAGAALQRGEAAAYRFETIDLGQTTPTSAPMEIVGGTLRTSMPTSATLSAHLVEARARLIDHINGSMWPGDDELLGAMGTYEPATDRYDPLIARNLDQALLAFSLGRAAQDDGVDPVQREEALATALLILDALAKQEGDRAVDECIGLVLACSVIPETTLREPHRIMAAKATEQLQMLGQEALTSDAHTTAMAAYAMTLIQDHPTARRLAERAWNALPVEQYSTLLPWIVWTELELDEEPDQGWQNKLLQIRSMLHRRQVPAGDLRFGSELSGGYVLGQSPLDVTAQSLRPGAALPSMITSTTLTPIDDRPAELKHMEALAMFLLRLQITTEGSALHRNPARSTGGIRLAAWDTRMPPAAQAMALLMLQELLELWKDPAPGAAHPDLY